MSTSAVSSSSLNQQLQSYFQTRNSDVQQLGQALQSGNLASAQVAYNNITALGDSGPFASGNAFRGQTRQEDFNAIGQALQSGDLAGAQSAFASLKSTVAQTASGGNPASPALPILSISGSTTSGGAGPEIVVNLGSTSSGSGTATSGSTSASGNGPEVVVNLGSTSGSAEQITINIGQTSGGGEQVSLSIGNQGTSQGAGQASSPEQITFNLSPNSNEQIVLNLLNEAASSASTAASTASTSTTGTSTSNGLSVSA